MRIKRTDKNFTAKKKADRRIHYAGQGKKYTKGTVNLSAKEKQDALRHSGYSGAGVKGQTCSSPDGSGGEARYDDIKICRAGYGNDNDNGNGNGTADRFSGMPEKTHLKQPRHLEYSESALQDSYFPVDGQSSQHKARHQVQHQVQPSRPSAFHENTIKTKETVIHRKQEAPDINRHTDTFIFKGKHFSAKEIQRKQPARSLKIRRESRADELRNIRPAGNLLVKDTGEVIPVSSSIQSFEDKRERQISGYKKKYLGFRKQERMGRNAYAGSDTARKPDTDREAGTRKTEEKYKPELHLSQLHQTGEPALSETQNNLHIQQTEDAAQLRTRASGDSIRQRGKGISGQRKQDKAGIKDMDTGRDSRKSRNTKENKKHGNDRKNTKRDTGSKSGAEKRRKRADTLRLLSYAKDKFSQEEQKDSLLKVAKELILGKAKAAAAGTLLSIGASLLPVLIPAFIITIVITLLFNSPFAILLPKLTDGPGVVEVLAEYTEDFRETVQEELADPGSGDETELIYEDYEGDGEPDNMADILMVYMKQHVRLSNQIQGWLQKYFPEYFECYADWDSSSGLMLLKEAPLPRDILKLGAGGINQIWRNGKVRAAGIKRAQALLEAAQNSVGLEGGEAARLEIWVLVNDYILKEEQLKRLDGYLEEKVKEVPNVEKLLAIKGVGLSTVIGFVAEVGDIGRFTDPKQIQKLAGLEIVKKSSGKKKGQPRISKRGRRKLRRTMYESARALINWNPAFQDVFLYYRNRGKNPLGGMQAKIAVACKAIRIFYVVLKTGCEFDEERFRRDIIRPEAA